MQITRNYVHRKFGAIGSIVLTAPDGEWALNGNVLPESSVVHLITFAGQTLQDAYAGADNAEDAIAAFETKLRRLIEGTIGVRGGDGADEFTVIARRLVESFLRTHWGKDSVEWKAFDESSDADQNAKLDKVYADNEAVFKPQVETKIANAKAERERKAALKGAGIKIDI